MLSFIYLLRRLKCRRVAKSTRRGECESEVVWPVTPRLSAPCWKQAHRAVESWHDIADINLGVESWGSGTAAGCDGGTI